MAWLVYGAMDSNGYSRYVGGEVYGPLPHKRWIKKPGEKYKLAYHFKVAPIVKDATAYNERKAVDCARWLSHRDGTEGQQTAKTRCEWSGVTDPAGKWRKRIQAVEFGRMERKRVQYGPRANQWRYEDQWTCTLRVEIPHWDFQHPPIEQCEAAL